MLNFKDVLKLLENSDEFKKYRKDNPNDYLSYALFVDNLWKVGYCNKENKITSFNIDKRITIEPDEEVLQKEKKKIKPIELEDLKIEINEAIKIADDLQKKKFSKELIKKMIVILQVIDKLVWNITFLTQSFNTLNIKIDGKTGKVVEKKLSPLFRFDK